MILHQRGHLAEEERASFTLLDRHLPQIGRGHDRLDVPDSEPLSGRVDEPARPDHRSIRELQQAGIEGVGRGLHDPVERDALGCELLGIDLDLQHLEALAPDGDVGHTGHAQQAGPDLPIRRHRQLDRRVPIRGEPDLEDAARRREWLDHGGRARPARQRRRHGGEALCNQLARLEQVGPTIEDELNRRELGNRLRTGDVEARHAVEDVLERNGDQSLDLGCREAQAGSLDLYARRRELREGVNRALAKLLDAEEHHRRGEPNDKESVLGARGDEPAHQDCPCLNWVTCRRSLTRPRGAQPRRRSRLRCRSAALQRETQDPRRPPRQ